ncbi:MAG: class I SAM-dependent methyltransferase [Candidatus Bathyarchaeota archaeon]|nr:MAG: class I SAM-dependent methyltransferase [Candidatus Bathyarchaeota archaeon]
MPKVYTVEMCLRYLIKSTPIYDFFKLCELAPLEKIVLDCGAGGKYPPLTIFHDHGYETYGIEIGKKQLDRAQMFCRENGLELNIFRADMRILPFADKSFSFVFAYESIFFLTRDDIAAAMEEIERVLKPMGLCFVTFKSVEDSKRVIYSKKSVRAMLGSEGFTYHEYGEPDMYFNGFQILQRNKRIKKTLVKGKKGKRAYIDYIARKK